MEKDIDLKKKTLEDLKYIAKMMKVKGISRLKKDELIAIILEHASENKEEAIIQQVKQQEEKPMIKRERKKRQVTDVGNSDQIESKNEFEEKKTKEHQGT